MLSRRNLIRTRRNTHPRCSPSTQNPRLDTHEVSTMEFFLPQIGQVFLSPDWPLTSSPAPVLTPSPEVGQARHGQGCRHLPPSLRWTQLSRARVALPGAIETTQP